MQTKTGDAPADPGRLLETVLEVVAEETGSSVEAVQAAIADGQDLVDIIESSGVDVETVRTALIAALELLPEAENIDTNERADLWLNRSPD
jgi:hypothetical protein